MAKPDYLPPFDLRPHQVKALDEMHNACVLRGGVGSGKTYTALVYYLRKEAPKDIYVITTARKRDSLDWPKSAAKMNISTARKTKYSGVLHVDSWNNITKYVGVEDAFFIFDEQRLVGSGTWVKSFLKISRVNNWVMLSATPGDTWMDYIPIFVANGFYRNRTEFIRNHVVYSYRAKYPKVERYIGTATLARYRRMVLVEMPFERTTQQHIRIVFTKYDEFLMDRVHKDRWNIFKNQPITDITEEMFLRRKIVNSDASKVSALTTLAKQHPRLIIFYNFDYELEILREWAEAYSGTWNEWNGHKHEEVPTTDTWVYLVQYTAGAEAWNCTSTDTIVFYSMTYSWKTFEQARGRIDRLDTPYVDLWYYILRSKASIDEAIYRSLMNKKDFNEKAFITKERRKAIHGQEAS